MEDNNLHKLINKDFLLCGAMGWGFECFFTGCKGLFAKKKTLPCSTSLWMFGIYGLAFLIKPLYYCIKKLSPILRGSIYTVFIFITEYFTGAFLKRHNACPWDYSSSKFNIKGVIRLDYAPLLFIVGLIYENILKKSE